MTTQMPVTYYLVVKRIVRGGGPAQYGEFLGMLASIGVPFAIELVSKLFAKGMHVRAPVVGAAHCCHRPKEKPCTYALLPSLALGVII